MNRYIAMIMLLAALPAMSCLMFKKPIMMNQVVEEKARIDAADNPALQEMIRRDLGKRRIELAGLTVKDILPAANIDYDFCVTADVSTPRGMVECHIYSDNLKAIAQLEKGKTKINVKGEFGRFFTLIDNYYTRLEVVNARITIVP